tara:strand:- start:3246 stop:3512 length:267 start_codon:yes stop_codon:yes gene_type:complete
MAQYRGTIQGNRGEASRLGTKSSGLTMTSNGWESGIKVRAYFDAESNKDWFIVWSTGGSNARTGNRLLGVFTIDADGKHLFQLDGVDR